MSPRPSKRFGEKPLTLRELCRFGIVLLGLFLLSCIGLALGFFALGPMYPILFGGIFSVVLSLFSIIMLGVLPFSSWRVPSSLQRILLSSAGLILICALDLPVAFYLWRAHAETLRAYPEKVAAPLEAYKKQHGAYPPSLAAIPGLPSLPEELSYSVENDGTYTFAYSDPWSMLAEYDYSSSSQKWNYYAD